jgi:hypothetical protein
MPHLLSAYRYISFLRITYGGNGFLGQEGASKEVVRQEGGDGQQRLVFAVAPYSVVGLPEFSFSKELTLEEKKESSSIRERLAIRRMLLFWGKSDILKRPLE